MKISQCLLILIIAVSGCSFQKPDYLRMVSADELNSILQREDVFLVDVHTPKQRHIKGTDLYLPYDQMEQLQDQLPRDKTAPIYLYCESGPMANAAARSLHKLGYLQLYNLEGGASAWRKKGFAFQ